MLIQVNARNRTCSFDASDKESILHSGLRHGIAYGTSDEIGWKVAENPVDVHDFHATMLHLLGIEHTRLSVKFQGLDARLTNVSGRLVPELLA